MEKGSFNCPSYNKPDWHKGRMKSKSKFVTKGKYNNTKTKSSASNNETSSTNQEPDDIPLTPVVDIADSSDDHYSDQMTTTDIRLYNDNRKKKLFNNDGIENQQMTAAKFETLQKSSTGGHFIFNSEKQWLDETIIIDNNDNNETNKYFKLNLELIKAGLDTIPFYKRMDYDSSMFTKNQLKSMNSIAEANEKNYLILMKDFEEGKLHDNNEIFETQKSQSKRATDATSSASSTNKNGNEIKIAQNEKDVKDDDEILNELLGMTTKNVENLNLNENVTDGKVIADDSGDAVKETDIACGGDNHEERSPSVDNIETNKKEDIQEWLDGILDE